MLILGSIIRLEDEFKYDFFTGARDGCSALYNGQMLFFGCGRNDDCNAQISQLTDCGLKRIGAMPHNFGAGACTTLFDEDEYVLLCFGYGKMQDCHK